MKKIFPLILCAFLAVPNFALAEKRLVTKTVTVEEEVDASGAVIPETSKFGLYGSILGDPGVNLLGINLAYQVSDDFRIDAGFGTMFSFANSVGVDARYYIPTGGRFRPFLGLGLNALFVSSSDLSVESNTIDFPSFTIVYPNLKVGVEYHAPTGFFVSLHFSGLIMIYSGSSSGFLLDPYPALSIGSFF